MMTFEEIVDLADRIRCRRDGPELKKHRYDPVSYTDAALAQADADGWLAGLDPQDRGRLREELIRIAQSDAEWIEGLKHLDYEDLPGRNAW
jgi:hypothetical protein